MAMRIAANPASNLLADRDRRTGHLRCCSYLRLFSPQTIAVMDFLRGSRCTMCASSVSSAGEYERKAHAYGGEALKGSEEAPR